MKYSNVSEYLNDRYNEELPSVIEKDPAKITEQLKQFEKEVVNNKRFVTKITRGTADSAFGKKDVFKLEKTTQLDDAAVLKILQLSKATVEQFNEKFNWTAKNKPTNYGESTQSGILSTEAETPQTPSDGNQQEVPKEKTVEKTFSFDEIDF